MSRLQFGPCVDSKIMADLRRKELALRPELAESLGRSAHAALDDGGYLTDDGWIDWAAAIEVAQSKKISLRPDADLPIIEDCSTDDPSNVTTVTVANETTLGAAYRMQDAGYRPLALNFANGVEPGGGFLRGATAQEEALCRSSALYATLFGDPMYDFHRNNDPAASSNWAILSADVPVFRNDAGMECDKPWLLSLLTCAAPYAPAIGRTESTRMLRQRIYRVLAIAKAYRYKSLVLGAWGCGAFANDPRQTAFDFRVALEGDCTGAFERVVFAIADWSDERRYLGPFREVFSEA